MSERTILSSAQPQRIPVGTRLSDIYEIDGLIGTGGMGEVYRGHAIETGHEVAIKTILPEFAHNEAALTLFRKEASALHHLQHDAIVRYYVFTVDRGLGVPYLAMEYVQGESLCDARLRGPIDFDSLRVLQVRLASGLQAAHERGVFHRDVSPDNVILPDGHFGRAKIIDFGIARSVAGEKTVIGTGFAGKLGYVAPEQLGLFGGDVAAAADIYSLGLVLAEAALGRSLDMGGSYAAVVEKRRRVPDLTAVDSRIRPLLESMLQPDPAKRPASMGEVAAWVPAIRQPTAARPRRTLALVAAGAVLIACLGGGAFLVLPNLFDGSVKPGSLDEISNSPRLEEQAPPPTPPRQESQPASPSPPSTPPVAVPPPAPSSPTLSPPAPPTPVPPTPPPPPPPPPPRISNPAPPSNAPPPPPTAPAPAPQRPPAPVPPTNVLPEPAPSPPPRTGQGTSPTPAPNPVQPAPSQMRPSSDQVAAFIRSFPLGECASMIPITIGPRTAALEAFGAETTPFQAFDAEFQARLGFEPSIQLRLIAPPQCPVIAYQARQSESGQVQAPRLTTRPDVLKSGQELQGTVEANGFANIELLLVSDDGLTHNVTSALKRGPDGGTFALRIEAAGGGPAVKPQLLLALGSSKPLPAVKSLSRTRVEAALRTVTEETARLGANTVVVTRYFKLSR